MWNVCKANLSKAEDANYNPYPETTTHDLYFGMGGEQIAVVYLQNSSEWSQKSPRDLPRCNLAKIFEVVRSLADGV